MPTWTERLLALLPPLYRIEDTQADLLAVLQIIGSTLDDLTAAIDGLPTLASSTTCPPEFLPFLAGLVGVAYDTTADPTPQRQAIQDAIARYQRIGTLTGLRRDLLALGWTGEIRETYPHVLRLNTRGRLNRQKLPGQQYNLGIYGVTEMGVEETAMQAVLVRHQPAGTRLWVEREDSTV